MKKRITGLKRKVTALLISVMLFEQVSATIPASCVNAEGETEAEYEIEHSITSVWGGGCNAELVLKNLCDIDTKKWTISFSTTDEITDIWGGSITECKEINEENAEEGYEHYYRYTVEALEYTKNVLANDQIKFGYTAFGNVHDIWDTEADLIFDSEGVAPDKSENALPIGGTYTGEGYIVEVIISDSWDGAYNVRLLINNTSEETIHNWGLVMQTNDKVTELYNAVELSDNEGVRLIKNAGYNQDIPVNGIVEIGYTAFYENIPSVPREFALSQIEKKVESTECEVNLFVTDEWETGGLAQIIITNTSEQPIEDWMLEFDSTLDITEIWGAVIESHDGEHYFLRNAGYAQNIMPGESWTVGVLFNGESAEISNVEVKKIDIIGDASSKVAKEDPTPYIQYMDTTPSEDTEDIGEVYFKELSSCDDLIMNSEGALCARDQIMITVNDGVTKAEVEYFANQNGFRIVGAIILTGDYQLESIYELNNEELDKALYKISRSEIVDSACYNYISMTEGDFGSSDNFTDSDPNISDPANDWGSEWTEIPAGNNWGIEAIDFEGALVNAGIVDSRNSAVGSINNELFSELSFSKIGLIDEGFNVAHDDLYRVFTRTWNNTGKVHGTHVAGIMAAEFNNHEGISGISIRSKLFGFSINGTRDITFYKGEERNFTSVELAERINHLFKTKCGLVLLIGNNVRVINYSLCSPNDQVAILRGDDVPRCNKQITLDQFKKRSMELNKLLVKLRDMGYDFLIVTSAGNANYTDDNSPTWFYSKDLENAIGNGFWNSSDTGILEYFNDFERDSSGRLRAYKIDDAQAVYNSELNFINSDLVDQIICVGAMDYTYDSRYGIVRYFKCGFSNGGDRVDIFAPGKDIVSCVPGVKGLDYSMMDGTSMAAPYVAGLAGLAYSVDPNLKATDLKKLIINGYTQTIDGTPVLNAAEVINAVVNNKDKTTEETEIVNGFVAGVAYYATENYYMNGDPILKFAEGADVRINSQDGLYEETVKTDLEGNYHFVVPRGIYDLNFHLDGYNDVDVKGIKVIDYKLVREDAVFQKTNNGKLHIIVRDENGIPASNADIRIYHMGQCYVNAMGGLIYEAADSHKFSMVAKTDSDGEFECYLEGQNSTCNGCYVILIDKDNVSGKVIGIGRMEWPQCLFYDGIVIGETYDLNVVLESYSGNAKVEFQMCSNRLEEEILYSSNVCLYKGWNLGEFISPSYQYTAPDGGWFAEISGTEVPMGCYTAEIKKDGYPTQYIEILVSDNNRTYLAVMTD